MSGGKVGWVDVVLYAGVPFVGLFCRVDYGLPTHKTKSVGLIKDVGNFAVTWAYGTFTGRVPKKRQNANVRTKNRSLLCSVIKMKRPSF